MKNFLIFILLTHVLNYGVCQSTIEWDNLWGVEYDGNTLTKTSAIDLWNSGSISTNVMEASQDGSVEFVITESINRKSFGFISSDDELFESNMRFGVKLKESGSSEGIMIIHKGLPYITIGTFNVGDVLRLERISGFFRLFKNTTLVYESSFTFFGEMKVATFFKESGGTIDVGDVSFSNSIELKRVSWQNLVNVSVEGYNGLVKTGGVDNVWDAGASSIDVLPSNTDGWIEVIGYRDVKKKFIGFAVEDIDASTPSIMYGVQFNQDGELRIIEGGDYKGPFGTFETKDIIKIERVNGTIKYYNNDVLLYTSLTSSVDPLIVDASIKYMDGLIPDVLASFVSQTSNTSSSNQLETLAIGVGEVPEDFLLAVGGKAILEGVQVELSEGWPWPDFVFGNEFGLRTLEEVEKYISINNHLPGIPSEVEVTENGINLGEMDAKLLQKIEELTLYLIEQNKQILAQQERITILESKLTK